jgi:hypothetical protein
MCVIQRRAVVASLAASIALLAGCGFQAPDVTASEHNSIQGHDFQVGGMRVRAASITTFGATPATTSPVLTSKPTTYLTFTLVNNGVTADTLTGITTPLGTVTLAGAGVFGGSLTVPPHGVPVSVSPPAFGGPGGTTATVAATTPPGPGTSAQVQLTFATAGTSPTEIVPVVPATASTAVTSPVPTGVATPPVESGEPASD